MKKDKKFLTELENNLVGVKDKYKKEIISKYEERIKEEKAQNKKITSILKGIGKPEEVALREIEALGNKGKLSIFDSIKNKLNEFKEKRRERKEQKENDRLKKTGIKVSVNGSNVKSNKKNKKEIIKEEKAKIKTNKKEEKEKTSFKEKFNKFKEFITKDITFKKKEKVKKEKVKKERVPLKERFNFFKKKKEKEVKLIDTPKEIVSEVKEEISNEVSEVSEIVSETHIFESKEKRRRRILLKTLGVILTTLLIFIWMWVSVIFVASLVAYLDGVKFTGLIIALFGLDALVLWIVIMVNRAIFKHKMSLRLNLIVSFVSVFIIAIGIVLGLKQIYKIENIKDVSIKYSMVTKLNNFDLPDDKDKKFTLTFNSNYNTQYTINYDNNIKDKVKVEVRYYECYYDFYTKKVTNGAYISLSEDDRDRLSTYIDDLKEGQIFDNDELARYTVKITINQNDASRLSILD